ncbi:hypothetical protein [Tunicatimonas pelagia]|uniref:hypothetical protein n=1 Tax=Tunicatimonas pelagia TaxID=931531 RepID=UPI002666728D|nr:hypothetical protein [Tunicatimonas pelagia]WKN44326.1 hypothetical protein P0M28_05025 [Tunicatimonas pelagia]
MKLFKEHPIIFIPIALLLAFLLLPLLDKNPQPKTKQASLVSETSSNTGFLDYDLLPEELKQRMEELVERDSVHSYFFYYFFETEDINRHYFLDDDPTNMILEAQPVTNSEVLELVDERLTETRGRGFSRAYHPSYWEELRSGKVSHENWGWSPVTYIASEYEADFRQLRVGIIRDTLHYFEVHENEIAYDTKTYNLLEVDTPPHPVRGTEYFHNAIRKYLKDQLVYFQFYDMVGAVKAEFTIGGKASSPQIIEGFSTRETERDEAYKLDGLIVKALNNLKVHWKSGQRNEKNVNTRVAMNVHFSFDETGAMEVNFSEFAPATRTF